MLHLQSQCYRLSNSHFSVLLIVAGPFGNAESGDDCAIFVPSHKKSSLKGKSDTQGNDNSGHRLNKFVRHLHDMLVAEKDSQAVEWRCGLLILQNTASFAATILPKYFDTRNFKTFRRQLNYYGFVHVRSYSKAASSTIAIWVNRSLIETVKNPKEICSVLSIKRVETCETSKTSEGRQLRKQMAISAADEYINTCLIVAPKQCDGYKIDKAIQESKLDGIIGKKLDVVLDPIQNLKTSPIVVSSVSVTSGDSFPNSYVRSPGSIQRTVSNEEDESSPKTPRSSTSAANLLLLLSKAG